MKHLPRILQIPLCILYRLVNGLEGVIEYGDDAVLFRESREWDLIVCDKLKRNTFVSDGTRHVPRSFLHKTVLKKKIKEEFRGNLVGASEYNKFTGSEPDPVNQISCYTKFPILKAGCDLGDDYIILSEIGIPGIHRF